MKEKVKQNHSLESANKILWQWMFVRYTSRQKVTTRSKRLKWSPWHIVRENINKCTISFVSHLFAPNKEEKKTYYWCICCFSVTHIDGLDQVNGKTSKQKKTHQFFNGRWKLSAQDITNSIIINKIAKHSPRSRNLKISAGRWIMRTSRQNSTKRQSVTSRRKNTEKVFDLSLMPARLWHRFRISDIDI
jgi:hypothetical protein